jgi:hypothetical protein
MNVDVMVRRLMADMSWVHGTCDDCGRTGSVAPYGKDEDDQPVGYWCFIHTKQAARRYVRDLYGAYGAS